VACEPRLASTIQSIRKRLEAPLNKLENAAVHLSRTSWRSSATCLVSRGREMVKVEGLLRVEKVVGNCLISMTFSESL